MAKQDKHDDLYSSEHKIAKDSYAQAISNYNIKKDALLNELNVMGQNASQSFIDSLNLQIVNEIKADGGNILMDKVDKIIAEIENIIKNAEKNKIFPMREMFRAIRSKRKSLKNETLAVYYKNAQKDFENFMSTTTSAKGIEVRNLLQGIKNDQSQPKEIAAQLYSYAQRLIINIVNGQNLGTNLEYYKNTLKGYYAEYVVTDAFNNLFSKLVTAVPTGTETGDNKKQVKIDIALFSNTHGDLQDKENFKSIFGELKDYDNTQLSAEGKTPVQYSIGSWGVQSKPWVLSWLGLQDRWNQTASLLTDSFLKVGGDSAGLLSSVTLPAYLYSWHKMMAHASENIESAIGNNVLYNLPTGVMWTSSLIQELQSQSYWLAFEFGSDHKTTTTIGWSREVQPKEV